MSKVLKLKMPPGMGPRAKKEFRRVQKELLDRGVEDIDRPALMAYLQHYALWEEARDVLEEEGAVITTPRGQIQINPWHSILKMNSELLKKWVNELGFSPASRKRLGLVREEVQEDDELY